jgi:predicted MFS family arabinose efflux permease
MIGGFTVFPYLSTYLVENVGMTEEQLPWIYMVGGALTLVGSPVIGRLADSYGKMRVYRIIAPFSAVLMLLMTYLPPVHVAIAVTVFGVLMVCNVGRMIAAMALVTGSVEPRRRGGFLSANSSVQHVASGIGASIGGLIITQSSDGTIHRFGLVGWIAFTATILSLWLIGRIRIFDPQQVSAERLSLAAAAEASVDAGEAMITAAEEAEEVTR